jgi:hypothetical protein
MILIVVERAYAVIMALRHVALLQSGQTLRTLWRAAVADQSIVLISPSTSFRS